ncbi:MAG: extracellular solute-binding protein [Acetobacteraceae bacterium]|nr:extracellular solute-binding protein [Acetobacteraceae bacterium]
MIPVTRRLAAAGFGAMLVPRPVHAGLETLHQAAKQEGPLTWYVAQMTGEAAESMGKRFTRRFPGVGVTAIRTTGQVAYSRLLQDLKNNTPQCDVFSSTDIAHYPALKARGALARYRADSAGGLAPAFHGLGDDEYFYPTTASVHAMVYNTRIVKPEDRPRRFTDLLDPKWKGRVAVAHPAFSGYFGQWVLSMRKLYGWEYFEKLAKNNPRIGRSGNDPIALIIAGECVVGTGPTSTATVNERRGNPVSFVYPEDGAILSVGSSAVMASAPHPNAARLFLEWLLSRDYAEACVEWNLEPVRADAPPLEGTKPLNEIKLLSLTTAEIAKGIPEVIEQWRDTFGG